MSRPVDRDGRIFSEDLIVKALRDSGYKNTAYAVAELIDNSIQANASDVEVICSEEIRKVNGRNRRRVGKIAVIDNGHGMDAEVLRASLMFGNGTHLEDRSGIGRFGMGLPNATFSQASRVDVWSWLDGCPNALWTYLDLEDILKRNQKVVPKPEHKPLPQEWRDKVRHSPGDTGTLVLWSKMDETRLTWKTSIATLRNTEEIVGRIYRKFIKNNSILIRLVAFEGDTLMVDQDAKVNDPLYLTPQSSTPEPFREKPMFDKWGDEDEVFEVIWGGETHCVKVRFSYAKPETIKETDRQGIQNRGDMSFGKHAAKNIGVSLVRAGRELDLDSNWAIGYNPVERWWGCEVEFPAGLDEIFGVTINKQTATLWSQFAQLDWSALAEEDETTSAVVIERLREEADPRGVLLDIAEYIRRQLKNIRKALDDQTKGRRTPEERHEKPSVEDKATRKIEKRSKEHRTAQDEEELGKPDVDNLRTDLIERKNYSEQVAGKIAEAVWKRRRRIIFLEAELDGNAFFKVEERPGGLTEVIFNNNHLFYDKIYETLNLGEMLEEDHIAPEERVQKALDTLRLMFAAWARYEQESTESERIRLNDVRQDWGRMVRYFLEDSDEE